MCWSAEVSLGFAVLDTFFVALLLARPHMLGVANSSSKRQRKLKRPTFCRTYAGIMAGVALQEWGQFGVWKRNRLESDDCTEAMDVFLGILTTSAAMIVPLPLIAASSFSSGQPAIPDYHYAMHRGAVWSWSVALSVLVFCLLRTRDFCVKQGPNHHQVWLCESATYQVGGHLLQYTCLCLYMLCCICATESVGQMPVAERRQLQVFTLASVSICAFLYGGTLEACSVWCWGAFILGLTLCAQVYGYVDEIHEMVQEWCSEIPKYFQFRQTRAHSLIGPAKHRL